MSRAPPASTRTHSTSSTASATSTASSVTAVDAKSIAEMDKQPENAKSVDGGRDNEAVSRGPEVDPPAHVAAGAPPPPPSSSSTSSHLTSDINTLSLPPSRDTGSPASTPAPGLSTTTAATDTDTVKGSAEPGSSPDPEAQREPDIYDRFSPSRKKLIVCIVSYAAFLGPIASSAFLPSIKIMAEQMGTSPSMINYTVAIFIVSIGVAPLVWSPLSGFYGRKPVYLMSMPIMAVASIGVAQSKNVGALIGTRILQGIGCSAVLSVGAGTVGDIYRPTERANAMAWFYSGVLLGPALSPVLAGIFTQYTSETWRATQYFLCAAAALSVVLIAFFLPETSHPVLPHHKAKEERGKKFVLYVFNPFVSLGLMQYPNISMITLGSSCILLQTYCVMVPLSVIFQERYHITNVAVAGCTYLSIGIGTLVGSRVVGPLADRTVRKYMEKRSYRRPEDRLHASLWGAGLISPASCLLYGWLLWLDKGGLWPPLIVLVINGFGMQLSLNPMNTYLVDAMQKRSAEAIAVNNFWRYMFSAAGSAFVLPMINAIGPGWTMTFASGVGWLGFVCIVSTMKWGEGWREAAKRRVERRLAAKEAAGAGDDARPAAPVDEKRPVDEKERVVRPSSPIGVGLAAPEDDAVFLDDEPAHTAPATATKDHHKEKKHHMGLGEKIKNFAHAHAPHSHSRRQSTASAISDHDHGEAEHGEPTHLVQIAPRGARTHRGSVRGQRPTDALNRERSRRGSTATLPSVGEMLQRTVSLSGASVHGG